MKTIFTFMLALSAHFLNAQMIEAIVTDPLCFIDETGSIDITFSDGVPPYMYQWSTGANTEDIEFLNGGFYTVTITDSQGQNFIGEWDLENPEPLEIDGNVEDPWCFINQDFPTGGAIDVSVVGGVEPYSFLWSDPNGEEFNEQFLFDVGGGTYTLTVTDNNGCTQSAEFEVTEPDEIIINAIVQNPSCVDGQSIPGSIEVMASGGTGALSYSWGGDVEDFNSMSQFDLDPGDYYLDVGDENGCINGMNFTLTGPDPIEITATLSEVGCDNGMTLFGSIELNVTGGIPPYTYAWTGNNVDPNASGQGDLVSGVYSVTVTDSENCQTETLEIEINNESIQSPNLCLITNDNADGYNTVYWEDPVDVVGIDSYNIYREGTSVGQFDLIGTVDFAPDNEFFDTDANSTQQAYRYYVTAANDCGHESAPSSIHKTIHLTINQGSFGNMNLIWDEYDGITYDQVVIYRGDTPQTLEEYVSLPGNVFSYTDSDALSGDAYYQIVITTSVNCNTSVEEAQKLVFDLKSNVAGFLVNSVDDVDWLSEIYPNPFEDLITVHLDRSAQVEVYDYQGNKISKSNLNEGVNTISTIDFPQGLYIVRIISNGESAIWRAMKSR